MVMPNKASRSCASNFRIAPTAIKGKASFAIENFKPSNATIQPVLVVPILAPIMTPIALLKVRTPALTKPMVANVVAVDDCTTMVRVIPENIAFKGESVKRTSHCLNASPASAFKLSVMRFMPNRNKPMPPSNCNKVFSTLTLSL